MRLAPSVFRRLRSQRGVSGLETAIILVAFVVVSSVFSYSVLTAGIFAADESKQAINAGLDQATSSIELVGETKADGVAERMLSTVDSPGAWVPAANVTVATETADRKEGAASARLSIAAGFTTGLIAYQDLASTVDLSKHYSAGLWIKSSGAIASDVLQLVLDDDTGCGSPAESLNIAALKAGQWDKRHMNMSNPSALTSVACVGLKAASDPGVATLTIDAIQGPGEVQRVILAMENTIPTEGISFAPTVDSDGDGLLSDESGSHWLIVSYMDQDKIVRDIAWSTTEVGSGDADTVLEYGELFLFTIELRGVDPVPTSNSMMTFLLAPTDETPLTIERRVPRKVSSSMILR